MKFTIKSEIKGRMRVHLFQNKMTYKQADTLLYYLNSIKITTAIKVYDKNCDVAISFVGDRNIIIDALKKFKYENVKVPDEVLECSGRELNEKYKNKLINTVVVRVGSKILLPYPVRIITTTIKSLKYIIYGVKSLLKGKLEVSVLDATAISVSIIRGDINTASSVMFLLKIGEILEEWTHKKSVDDLARSMSLNIEKVWLLKDDSEILVKSSDIVVNDKVVVHMGNVIPFDGTVFEGEAFVNQASLTGESTAVRKSTGSYVYAGTVVEEGEITIIVKEISGSTKFEKIVNMIEESEKLKSKVEGKAENIANKLVPYTFLGTGFTYLFTRNVTKTLSVLMVDFSCALKLAIPITVLSAIREASIHDIVVKGGKYLELVEEATTIVFDKTGTLTEAKPTVVDIVTFGDNKKEEILRISACLEEHFPHSMAKAVVMYAKENNILHKEMHSKVNYVVAHGISSSINDKKVIIGSYHFVFEDEKCIIRPEEQEKFDNLPEEYSHLYIAIENELVGVICIQDPLRKEASAVINSLKKVGIEKVVMMTGDSERIAKDIAKKVGIDEYYSEVLPEDKAKFIEKEKLNGKKVIMVGDGINDSPALSMADVGIAISDGAQIAREIADITISSDDLYQIVTLKLLSHSLMKRIGKNYRFIVGFNSILILLGLGGIIQPTTSALLHNMSTLGISLKSMQNLLD